MRAIVFLSSFDLENYFDSSLGRLSAPTSQIYSVDNSPIHLVNLVKQNRYEICREIDKRRREYPILQKTLRFGVFSL
jgi:hypothetical protein